VDLAGAVSSKQETYDEKQVEEPSADGKGIDWIQEAREAVFSKGQSKRIWNELYKVCAFAIGTDFRSLILRTC
jgi:nuclear GTP-binding protein